MSTTTTKRPRAKTKTKETHPDLLQDKQMAFFGTISVLIIEAAAKTKSTDGIDIYEIRGANTMGANHIPCLLQVDCHTETGIFLKDLADLAGKGQGTRTLVSGIVQIVPCIGGGKKGAVEKPPKLIINVGSARRLRADKAKDPEQATVFGAGFIRPQTNFNNKSERLPKVYISNTTESLVAEGEYSSGITLSAENQSNAKDLFMTVEDGKEVYFQGNVFRDVGEISGTCYDKLKIVCNFAQETERKQARKGGSYGQQQAPVMRGQLDSSFEDDEDNGESGTTDLASDAFVASLLKDF